MAEHAVEPIQVEVLIDAPSAAVWAIVSDLARMGEWSPECRKVVMWGRRGPRQGAWFTGANRRGRFVWPSTSRIIGFQPERTLAWRTWESGARWIYELEPVGDQTRLVERRELPDGMTVLARVFARAALGSIDSHDRELRDGMRTTLARIKQEAETRTTQ